MTQEKLIEAINRSGFPLQIGLQHLIYQTRTSHGWKVIYTEHSWKNPSDGCSGFIDLVLENSYGTSILIVESKRVQEASWLFLVDDAKQLSRRHAKSWLMQYEGNQLTYFGLKELTLDPATPQSQYCVVDGQDPKSKPMIERIASDVVSSTEGFAIEEREYFQGSEKAFRMYFNVIVTTAKLKVCSFDPANVSIADGKVQDVNFTEVPYLRFRKQLTNHHEIPKKVTGMGYHSIALAKESTVFIVNAESFPNFLSEFEVG